MTAKTYPARKAAGKRRQPLPPILPVTVRFNASTYVTRARGVSCSSTASEAMAVRRLAEKLGYGRHADVRYVSRGDEGVQHFEIVEVQP